MLKKAVITRPSSGIQAQYLFQSYQLGLDPRPLRCEMIHMPLGALNGASSSAGVPSGNLAADMTASMRGIISLPFGASFCVGRGVAAEGVVKLVIALG